MHINFQPLVSSSTAPLPEQSPGKLTAACMSHSECEVPQMQLTSVQLHSEKQLVICIGKCFNIFLLKLSLFPLSQASVQCFPDAFVDIQAAFRGRALALHMTLCGCKKICVLSRKDPFICV